jgi:hypothetical protein
MKAVRAGNPKQLSTSLQVALDEIEGLADMRARGDSSPEFLADLKNIKDETQLAAIEAQLKAQLEAQNRRIGASGSTQQPIQSLGSIALDHRRGHARRGGGPGVEREKLRAVTSSGGRERRIGCTGSLITGTQRRRRRGFNR